MTLKNIIREKAFELGFEAVGFTHTAPLDLYIREIESRPDQMYGWVQTDSFNVKRGASFCDKHPWAKSLLVLIRNYHRKEFPRQLVGRIGRCYQVDERIEKGEEHNKLTAFFDFLKGEGLQRKFDEELPARMSAARAGVVTYGKNCFVFARNAMRGASWLESIPILLDKEIEPDPPSIEFGCPDWCKNACMAACPTGALYAPGKMNPKLCIAYNSYYGKPMTPMKLREPMGTWIYGCDRCQEVCPRNQPWMNQVLPENPKLLARADDFDLTKILLMDKDYYINRIWPLTFYISKDDISKWQTNAARALGNLGDRENVPFLMDALENSPYAEVRGMSAWALGRLAGGKAKSALETKRLEEDDLVKNEINLALENM
jgi:epoxyqueuosine reductase